MFKFYLRFGTLTLFHSRCAFHLSYEKLVTYQVTNDHGLSCLHKLNTSNVQ